MIDFHRRQFLRGSGALLAGAASALAVSACGGRTTISTDPDELVLWYWDRSISRVLLDAAAEQIPGTDKRLRPDMIGGGYDNKLRTSLAGNAYIPDIAVINSNCALYFPNEDRFWDLNELGAAEYAADYFDWKWRLGTSPTGRQLFWPMDTGPTAFYYRADVFEEAGLPSDPDDVSEAVADWDAWIELGVELRQAADVALINRATDIFIQYLNASPERFLDPENRPLYAEPDSAVRRAWDIALRAIESGVTAKVSNDTELYAAYSSGRTVGNIDAVWWAQVLTDAAPDTEGLWRIAHQPGPPGNSGGSFLGMPTSCKDPDAAMAFITWLTTPERQAQAFNELQLFPSAQGAFDGGLMVSESSFFGDQDYLAFFAGIVPSVPQTFVSTYESQVGQFGAELANVESGGKDPEQAWRDGVAAADKQLRKRGVI